MAFSSPSSSSLLLTGESRWFLLEGLASSPPSFRLLRIYCLEVNVYESASRSLTAVRQVG